MRSADIRSGLIRVAALGRKVLSVPEMFTPFPRSRGNTWRWVIGGAAVLVLLLVGAWYAGRESAGLEAQRFGAELNTLSEQVASTQLALQQEKAQTDQLQRALAASGKAAAVAMESQLRKQLLRAQADANDYKQIIERERDETAEDSRLLDALSHPGAHLLPLKGAEVAAESTAYALLVENSSLMVVASNLPALENGRQFQVWVVRKQDPKIVSAGVFTPDSDKRAFMSYDESSILSDIAQVEVTDEPQGGSSTPTGTKLMESPAGPESARPAPDESGRTSEEGLPVESSLQYQRPYTSR